MKVEDFKKQIELLKELQGYDLELRDLNFRKEDMPKKLQDFRFGLDQKKEDIDRVEEEVKDLQIKIKDKELELQTAEGGIQKFQQQLLQIKTNKEYKALLSEIEGKKADNSCIEDEILKLMDSMDEIGLSLNKEKDELKKLEGEFQQEEDKVKQDMAVVEQEIKSQKTERGKIAQKVDPETLSIYERLIESKDGLAIVPVIDGACGGCHLSLRPQTINEIKRADGIITCERCSRIFYLDE
ncbi:MAG: C4-type zinc ribbon domain-containing protein [Candidatus Kaelpia aquatica]|nr:C4-type zinc ribbon domain-containing protein [Candidatus Kaelpia aquatica]